MRTFIILVLISISCSLFAQNQTNEAGRKVGYWKLTGADKPTPGYDESTVVEEGEFQDGRKVGLWKAYYPSGKLKSEITHENGQLMIEGNWNGGKEDGAVKEYYANGDLMSVRVFNGGKMDAAKSQFKEASTPAVAVKDDPEPVNDDNNKVKTTIAVSQQEAAPNIGRFDSNGPHTLYNKNRQIHQKGIFKNGRLMDGKIYKYSKDGILETIEIYSNGQYVGEGVITVDMK